MCKSEMAYAVYLCGPTDCFLNAVFVDEDRADAWGKMCRVACDGYFVKSVSYDEVPKLLRED